MWPRPLRRPARSVAAGHRLQLLDVRARRDAADLRAGEQFTLKSGGDALTDYEFNKHVIHHLFCNVCGIKSFARGVGRDGSEQFAVNVRCLDGVDVEGLNVQKFDGRSR